LCLQIVKTGEEDFGKKIKILGLPFSEEGTIKMWGFDGALVSGSSLVIANIDDHWRLTWSFTSEPVEISRGARKLTQTPPRE